jgi:hypothetical protein
MEGILVATPCYGDKIWRGHFLACLALRKEFLSIGLEHDWLTIGNESLITRGRNVLAAIFLNETEFSHLLFIDSDIEFNPADVAHLWNLCDLGAGVAAGAYRMKRPGAPLAAWVDGKLVDDVAEWGRPRAVDYAGTGFMLIPRKTFEVVKEKARGDNQFPFYDHEEGDVGKTWNFFDTGVSGDLDSPDWQARFYLSEDYWWCERVRKAGLQIMMDPKCELKHHGHAVY